jgi:hypothetical protein
LVHRSAGNLPLAKRPGRPSCRLALRQVLEKNLSLVPDSSATLAWNYADGITESIRHILELVSRNGAWVPGLWKLEVANIPEMGVRRGRHDAFFWNATLVDLALFTDPG